MIHKIFITIFVHDLKKSMDFYIKKLDFKIHVEGADRNDSWVTLYLKDAACFELILLVAVTAEEKALVGKQTGENRSLITFAIDDCQKTYDELVERGVHFFSMPEVKPWGTSCTFSDFDGNIIRIFQPAY